MRYSWAVISPSVPLVEIQRWSRLPFLYQTRSLLASDPRTDPQGQGVINGLRKYTVRYLAADGPTYPSIPTLHDGSDEGNCESRGRPNFGVLRPSSFAKAVPKEEVPYLPRYEYGTITGSGRPVAKDRLVWDIPQPKSRSLTTPRSYDASPSEPQPWDHGRASKIMPAESDIPFEGHDNQLPHDSPPPSLPLEGHKTSTMTPSETRIFGKIYERISKSTSITSAGPRHSPLRRSPRQENQLEPDEDEELVRAELAGLFEEATRAMGHNWDWGSRYGDQDEASHNTSSEQIDAGQDTLLPLTPSEIRKVDDDQQQAYNDGAAEHSAGPELYPYDAIKQARIDYARRVEKKLRRVTSDVELWNVLETEVFILIAQLNQQNKLEEKARKAEARKLKKEARATGGAASGAKRQAKAKGSRTAKEMRDASNSLQTISLKKNEVLHRLHETYAVNCFRAARIYRQRFPASPYALHLLSHIKSLGPISYVLGATSPLYDEILFQKWNQFADVKGMADTLQEMYNQGVAPTLVTIKLLRLVSRVRTSEMIGNRGEVFQAFWGLRTVVDGWKRVKTFYDHFKHEVSSRQAAGRVALQERETDAAEERAAFHERRYGKRKRVIGAPSENDDSPVDESWPSSEKPVPMRAVIPYRFRLTRYQL